MELIESKKTSSELPRGINILLLKDKSVQLTFNENLTNLSKNVCIGETCVHRRNHNLDVELGESTTGKDSKLAALIHRRNIAKARRKYSSALTPLLEQNPPRRIKRTWWVYVLMGVSTACVVWIVIRTFAPKPVGSLNSDGWVCSRNTVCAEEWWALLLLAISRLAAYFCYPLMMLLFLSKTNNLRTLLIRTPISLFVPLYDFHQIHVFCGNIVGVGVLIHGICHMLRWGLQGRIDFIWKHATGITGAICFVLTPLIVWPMAVIFLKSSLSWEIRKGLHYLAVMWGITIMFHAPKMQIIYLMGVPVILYLLDWIYGFFARTYFVDKAVSFTRLDCGVELTFKHPVGFKTCGAGYIMVCIPWTNKWEWHAFSLYAHPSEPNHSCICMSMHGDWTKALHDVVKVPTTRPVFVAGPYASPFATALNYDNLILVASGIGITPALSIMRNPKGTKRVNLIW